MGYVFNPFSGTFDNTGSDSDTAAVWGSITGTLANQTDLNTELDARVLVAGDTMTGSLIISAGQSLSVDTISEVTSANGVVIDSLRIKDGGIADTNGNELFKFTTTTSAVNELTIANAATTTSPIISATGGDTNIGITFTPKGIGKLFFNGAQKVIRTTVADQAYQVLDSDYIIAYTSISATRVVTLVASATAGAGAIVIIKDESGSVTTLIKITVDGNGAELVDGAAGKDITAPYGVLRLYCNGSNWFSF